MKKMKSRMVLLAMALSLTIFFVGCKGEDKEDLGREENTNITDENLSEEEDKLDEKDKLEDEDLVELSDWDGIWNNMGAYLDDEELKDAFEELAEKEGVSIEEAKASYGEKRRADFNGMVIEDGKITFLDDFKDRDGKEIESVAYEYKETYTVKHGNFDMEWFVFEALDDAKYSTLLLMPVHGVETLTHFHLRYGNDMEELLENEDWYPTFVKPNSTYEQLHEEITE